LKRIYVLGHRGMLGEMVMGYFATRPGFDVIPIEQRFEVDGLVNYFGRFDLEPASIFINAIGAIPQKVSSSQDFLIPNVLLPLEIARSLAHQHLLIHPSTDCVFRGDRGLPYPSSAAPDASDPYGRSKIQGELALVSRPNTIIIRSSIIGPSYTSASGLLQWFLSQPKDATLPGYTNHLWNGMTTLEWCIEVEKVIANASPTKGNVVQYGWAEGCSKFEMLELLRDAFRPDIQIYPVQHHIEMDRRLDPDIPVPDLLTQIYRLKALRESA